MVNKLPPIVEGIYGIFFAQVSHSEQKSIEYVLAKLTGGIHYE